VKYHYADHLSVRVDTDSSGNVVRNYGSYPFGGTWYETLGTDKWKFTSYENDSESGLNYAGARYQSVQVGRFTALDPVPGHRRNPQSLNRYAYANNDPINLIDPTGMESDCNEFSNCDDSFAQLQDTGCASTFAGCNNAGDYGPPGADSNNDLPDAPTPNDGVCQWCSGEDVVVNVDFVFNASDRLIDPGPAPGSSNPSDLAGINENDGLDSLGGSQSDDFPVGSLAWNTFGPPSHRTWNGAYIVGEFAFGGTAAAIAGPAIIGELATMGTMQVAVMEGEPFHVAFGANGTMVHAAGETLGDMTIEQLPGRFFTMNSIPVYNIPVLNPAVVVPAIGSAAASCVTSACMGFVRGWVSF
jgi:RHS repeat-associated protein